MEIVKLFVSLALNARELTSGLSGATRSGLAWARDYGSRVSAALSRAFMVGIAAITLALGGLAADAIKTATDFEKGMSGVSAILSATEGQADSLRQSALDLSLDPQLKVSATEASTAMEMLARNGLDTTQILDGATRGVVLLSNATGGEFAQSADIATDVMALWGIEASKLTTAVDGITSVTTASKFSIDDYALALAQGGGVAASVGVEFQDFNAAIAAMSPLFASGSDAGTSFKVMLQRLVPMTNASADAMKAIGLAGIDYDKVEGELSAVMDQLERSDPEKYREVAKSFSEQGASLDVLRSALGMTQSQFLDFQVETGILQTAFHNLDGSLKSMPEIVDALNGALDGLSDKQKTAALSTIFGTDAMRAAAGLAELTEEQFRELQATMGDTSAAEQAATRIDNLSGDIEIFKSVAQGLQIQLGTALLPTLRKMVQMGSQLLTAYGPVLIVAIETIVGAVGTFADALENGFTWSGALKNALMEVFPPEVLETIFPIIDGIREFQTQAAVFVEEHAEALRGAIEGIGIALGTLMVIGTIGALIATLTNPITLVMGAAALLGAAWRSNWGGIQEKTQAVVDWVRGNLQPIVSVLTAIAGTFATWAVLTTVAGWIGAAVAAWGTFSAALATAGGGLAGIVALLGGPVTVAIAAIAAVVGALAYAWREDFGGIQEKTRATFEWIQARVTLFVETVRLSIETFLMTLQEWWSLHGEEVLRIVGLLWESVEILFGTAFENMRLLFSGFVALFGGDWTTFGANIRQIFQNSINAIVAIVRNMWAAFQPHLVALWNSLSGWWSGIDWGSLGRSIIDGVIAGVSGGVGALMGAVQSAAQAALDAAKAALGINSPSRAFAEQVGGPSADRWLQGWTSAVPALAARVRADSAKLVVSAEQAVTGRVGSSPLATALGNVVPTGETVYQNTDQSRKIEFSYQSINQRGDDRRSLYMLRSLENLA